MNTFYSQLALRIISSPGYATACDHLFEQYIYKMVNLESKLDRKTVRKLSTTLQYFYKSGHERFLQEGAIIMSMLLDTFGNQRQELIAIAENIFYQSGDFPNIKLLEDKFKIRSYQTSFIEESVKSLRIDLNTVEEIDHPLTDYQRSLWEDLIEDEDVITSAPTSTGKTHIILRYLVHKVDQSDGAFVAIIVPTRALISEIASKIYEIARVYHNEKTIEVCTIPKEGPFKNKTFFVVTQERLFEILQGGDIYFNYLFIDEAHNISDKGRGVLLHLTLQKLLEGSNPQIIISMPSKSYENAYNSVFGDVDFYKLSTKHSPVAKIVMNVAVKGRNLVISRINRDKVVTIDKGFTGSKLANIVFRLGQGESNIIYRNQTNHCENDADDISALIPEGETPLALAEAADYVEKFLHEDFTLASNLRKGVAFHYSPLPGVIRTMIEDLTRRGEINYVVCTSTLAEGVNLPAKNLFLKNPTQQTPIGQPSARLEDVKINNITGRAGRMLEHFAGNIFLIEHDKWDNKDYFEEREEIADKIPTFYRVLNEDLDGVLKALMGTYEHEAEDQYTYYTIANKLLRESDNDNLAAILNASELKITSRMKTALERHVISAYEDLKVDTFTLEANPVVGFIQQNKLYNQLMAVEDVSKLLLPHPMSRVLYDRIVDVCHILSKSGIFILKEAYSIEHACMIASKWIRGESLKSIINEQIKTDKDHGYYKSCNSSVRNVIKVINTDVRFRMSSALRCYHSILMDVLGTKELSQQSVKLHSFIEVGGCGERVINLVNFGLSRDTAIEIDRVLSKKYQLRSIDELRRAMKENKLDNLHIITRREISNLL